MRNWTMWKRWMGTAAAAVPMTLALSFSSLAGSWHQDMVGWWYETDGGSYFRDGWNWVDGDGDGIAECYYFNKQGYVVTANRKVGGYEVNSDGAWTKNGIVQTKALTEQAQNTAEALKVYEVEVLTAQQSLLSAQLSGISDEFQRMQAVVNLYHALGGGRTE